MADPRVGYRQVFDTRAALIAGLIATATFALVMVGLDLRTLNAPWFSIRSAASLLTGAGAFENAAAFDASVVPIGLAVYLVVGLALAFVIALLLHRFGLVMGIIGGAILGFSSYVLLYYVLARWLNVHDLSTLTRWPLEVGHVIFGAIAGGVYEWLERARYTRG
jgi:hypothetical protein